MEPSADAGRLFLQNGGQRIVTLLVYLNQPARGGRTAFPQLNLHFTPCRGTAIVFFPAMLDGRLDSRGAHHPESTPLLAHPIAALHAAEPAIDVKYVSQIWVRQSGNRRDAEPSRRISNLGAPAEGGSGSEEEEEEAEAVEEAAAGEGRKAVGPVEAARRMLEGLSVPAQSGAQATAKVAKLGPPA